MNIKLRIVQHDIYYADSYKKWSMYLKSENQWCFHRDKGPAQIIGDHYRAWWEYGMFSYAEDDHTIREIADD